MSDNSLRLVWIYPDLLSTYGDQGNALVVYHGFAPQWEI